MHMLCTLGWLDHSYLLLMVTGFVLLKEKKMHVVKELQNNSTYSKSGELTGSI